MCLFFIRALFGVGLEGNQKEATHFGSLLVFDTNPYNPCIDYLVTSYWPGDRCGGGSEDIVAGRHEHNAHQGDGTHEHCFMDASCVSILLGLLSMEHKRKALFLGISDFSTQCY